VLISTLAAVMIKQELHSAQYAAYKGTQIKNTAVSMKNEVMEIIAKVRERKGRLDLPIVSGEIHHDKEYKKK